MARLLGRENEHMVFDEGNDAHKRALDAALHAVKGIELEVQPEIRRLRDEILQIRRERERAQSAFRGHVRSLDGSVPIVRDAAPFRESIRQLVTDALKRQVEAAEQAVRRELFFGRGVRSEAECRLAAEVMQVVAERGALPDFTAGTMWRPGSLPKPAKTEDGAPAENPASEMYKALVRDAWQEAIGRFRDSMMLEARSNTTGLRLRRWMHAFRAALNEPQACAQFVLGIISGFVLAFAAAAAAYWAGFLHFGR